MYLLGLTTAYFVMKARAAARGITITKDKLYDLVVYAAECVNIPHEAKPGNTMKRPMTKRQGWCDMLLPPQFEAQL